MLFNDMFCLWRMKLSFFSDSYCIILFSMKNYTNHLYDVYPLALVSVAVLQSKDSKVYFKGKLGQSKCVNWD